MFGSTNLQVFELCELLCGIGAVESSGLRSETIYEAVLVSVRFLGRPLNYHKPSKMQSQMMSEHLMKPILSNHKCVASFVSRPVRRIQVSMHLFRPEAPHQYSMMRCVSHCSVK